MFIYKITNIVTGKLYIGQTIQKRATARWASHCWNAKAGLEGFLYNSMRKHGKDNFTFEVLVNVSNIDQLNQLEVALISQFGTQWPRGYNITPGGRNAPMAEEVKRKLSEKIKAQYAAGRKSSVRKNFKYHAPWNKGLKLDLSPERLEQLRIQGSKANKGRPKSEEHRRKLSEWRKEYYKTNPHPQAKRVICVDTGEVFDSPRKASEKFGGTVNGCVPVARVCRGERKTYKGLTFKYIL